MRFGCAASTVGRSRFISGVARSAASVTDARGCGVADIARQCIASAARAHGVTPEAMLSHSRSRSLVLARRAAMEAMTARGLTRVQVGDAVNRDHTTVCHALKK